MRAVVQRVTRAEVRIPGRTRAQIAQGLLVLLGVGVHDSERDADRLAEKIVTLRIHDDAAGKMNLDLLQTQGAMLVVSQFTLYADCRKGRRPGFAQAAPPELARRLYERFVATVRALGVVVETGEFGAEMEVELVNHGPVTILLDTQELFSPASS